MTQQQPIASPFGMRSTASEVISGIDLKGKAALVTGGYSGLGLETVRALAGAGAKVFVGARRPEAAAVDLEGVAGDITILTLDLSDPVSIDAFATDLARQTDRIDILINNAAIMACPLARDARGYESQFATNHLGHFQMTARIWPLLKAAGPGTRVVVLSSIGHARSAVDLADPHFVHRDYEKWTAYGQAKTANALFAMHFDEIGKPFGIRAFAVHPGGIKTPLQRFLTMDEQIAMGWFDKDGNPNPLFKSTEQGAATSIWCAVSPLLEGEGGVYCEDCNIAAFWTEGMHPYVGVRPHAVDRDMAAALWKASEKMTGVAFPD
ncbi:oxidoreductase [Aquisediminimonas profunda]|uniref:oxidoreductase n=1 Tax=Aquisediminimonas profunda TaxID=1550733 RepID=UPI001C625F58|nr:oxidoreductase [Aquisediminimonas profunda]